MATHAKTADPNSRGRRPDLEADLNEKNVKWTYRTRVPFAQFDLEKSLHNQARFVPLDAKVVASYADALKRGDIFPAVLSWKPSVSGGLIIIDGNHRLNAHLKAGLPLDVYEIDPTTDPRIVALMTFTFNGRHGMATSEAERVSAAVYLVDNGASIEAAASAVNLAVRIVKKAMARSIADARADEVGLRRNEWDSLGSTVKSRLGNVYTDEGFSDAAKLAYAAKLDSDEVYTLVGLLNATKSGMRQRAIVAHHKEMFSHRIGGVLATADRRKMGPKQRVGLAISQTLALPEDDQVILAAYAAAERPDAAKRMLEASVRLARLAKLMTEMDSFA